METTTTAPETTHRKPGPKPKPEGERGKQVCFRLHPALIKRLDTIRAGRTWPALLEMLADKWEGKE